MPSFVSLKRRGRLFAMQTSQASLLVQSSCRAYNLLLFFYPYSLRSRFEQEMLAVFEEQVHSAWEQSGYRGVLQSWGRSVTELFCIAFPARLDSLKIPLLSILLSLFLTVLFFGSAIPSGHCHK
jgi:hypothetical protein